MLVFTFTPGTGKLKESEGHALKLISGLMMLGLGAVLLAAPERLGDMPVAIGVLAFARVDSGLILATDRIARRQTSGARQPPSQHSHP